MKEAYHEIFAYMLDDDSKTFEFVQVDGYQGNYIKWHGSTYFIDKKAIKPYTKDYVYNEMLPLRKKFKRWFQNKQIGVLYFFQRGYIRPFPALVKNGREESVAFITVDDESNPFMEKINEKEFVVLPITRERIEILTKGSYIPSPSLTKVICTTKLYNDMIRSLPLDKKGMKMSKWIIIIILAVLIVGVVIFLTQSGILGGLLNG